MRQAPIYIKYYMTDKDKIIFTQQKEDLLRLSRETEDTETAICKMADYIITNKAEKDALINWMKEHEFFTSPASTCFHGNNSGGLAAHSLLVTVQALKLALPILENFEDCFDGESPYSITVEEIFIACIAHDLCKAGLYLQEFRNIKDEKGCWVKEERFTVDYDNRNLGHGNESVLRLIECMPSVIKNRTVIEAVSRHMGFSDLSTYEAKNFSVFLQNPLVILIQFADETAAAWYNC